MKAIIENRRILVGLTGGIACYKACEIESSNVTSFFYLGASLAGTSKVEAALNVLSIA